MTILHHLPAILRFRRLAVTLWLVTGLALSPLAPFFSGTAYAVDSASKTQSGVDKGSVLLGCMAGIAVGAVSLVLPPASAWVVAGVWWGGFSTMVVRAGFGCAYGALGGATIDAARSFVHWAKSSWRGRPEPRPIPIEGPGGS